LLLSKSYNNLKVDIIQSDLLLKGAPEIEELAKELKEILNDTRKIRFVQT
jgi:hypothetical protein